jgi:hypothetical protein
MKSAGGSGVSLGETPFLQFPALPSCLNSSEEQMLEVAKHCVYVWLCRPERKYYVGQTFYFRDKKPFDAITKDRFSHHLHGWSKFSAALKKYTQKKFKLVCWRSGLSREEADLLEYRWIEKFNSIKNGYNRAHPSGVKWNE